MKSVSPWLLLGAAVGGVVLHGKKAQAQQDTTPPTVTINPIAAVQPTAFPVLITVTGTAADNVQLSKVELAVFDFAGNQQIPYSLVSGTSTWSKQISMSGPGDYIIKARGTDSSGNTATFDLNVTINNVLVNQVVYYDNVTTPQVYNGISHAFVRNPNIVLAQTVRALDIQNCTDFEVDSGTIDIAKGGTVQSACIFAQNCNDIRVKGGRYQDASRACLIIDSQNVLVDGGEYFNTSVEGLRVNRCTNAKINNPYCHDTTNNNLDIGFNNGTLVTGGISERAGSSGKGVHYDSTQHARVLSHTVRNQPNTGHVLQGAQWIEIAGGPIDSITKNGIDIIDKTNADLTVTHPNHIYIHDLTMSNITGLPIYVTSAATEIWINNVTVPAGKSLPAKSANVHVNEGAPSWASQI